uniref:Uncharacterized protein n=1 Tax=Steinernema glaseri TaxID=37863 RepID=A0A1I7Y261_9BILA
MNRFPIAFWTHLCDILLEGDVTEEKELLGPFAELAQIAFHHMRERRQVRASEEIERIPKKFVQTLTINFKDAKPEGVSRELIRRFPTLVPTFLFTVLPSAKLRWTSPAPERERSKFISRRSWTTDQSDFFKKSSTLGSFFCLRGKRLVLETICEGGGKQLEEFLIHSASFSFGLLLRMTVFMAPHFVLPRVLKVCSKEECDVIKKKYRHNNRRFQKPSCVYKFEEGGGSERRRLFISFECATEEEHETGRPMLPASHRGLDDLGLMRASSLLQVLFA